MKWERGKLSSKLLDGDEEVGYVMEGLLGWTANVLGVSTPGFEDEKQAKAYAARRYKAKKGARR